MIQLFLPISFNTLSFSSFSSLPLISVVSDAVLTSKVTENVDASKAAEIGTEAVLVSEKPPPVQSSSEQEGVTSTDMPPTPLNGVEEAVVVVSEAPPASATSMAFPSIMHKDAFLIFRALCKLSMKGLHESDESGSLSDPIALQNK